MSSTTLPGVPAGTWLGHPKGLFLLFATEMWERFSYYGMRALLVLSLVAGVETANPGFGWTQAEALKLYGLFTGFVYFTPLIGGWLADNYLGQRKSVIIGGLVMAAGQFTLAARFPATCRSSTSAWSCSARQRLLQAEHLDDGRRPVPRRRCTSRRRVHDLLHGHQRGRVPGAADLLDAGRRPGRGWAYGYFAAGVGMILSVIIQLLFARIYLGDIGIVPAARRAAALAGGGKEPLTPDEVDRLRVIFMLSIFIVLFWAAFEQAGGLMNLYAAEKTDRMIGTFEVPAGWFQSLNPLFIVLLAPLFSVSWSKLGDIGRNPATPKKMTAGLVLTGIGFLAMVGAALQSHGGDAKASMWWLVIAYFFHTTGELCISPVGPLDGHEARTAAPRLVDDGRLVPDQLRRQLAGRHHRLVRRDARRAVDLRRPGGYAFLFAIVLWTLSGTLVRWMHGAEYIKH